MSTSFSNPINMEDDLQNQQKKKNVNNGWSQFRVWFIFLCVIVWIALGIAAYVKAFQCTSSKVTGSDARKIVMFIMAAILGPFWWILRWGVDDYCQVQGTSPKFQVKK